MLRLAKKARASQVEKVFGEELADFARTRGHAKHPPKLEHFWTAKWHAGVGQKGVISPLNGRTLFSIPVGNDLDPLVAQARACPKSGLFNPLKKPESYRKWGEVCRQASILLDDQEVREALHRMVYETIPKSPAEIVAAEVMSVKYTLDNWAGDAPRFAQKAFRVAGDRTGQETTGYRFPYGPVMIISPFNLPLKLSINNLLGALICGNFAVLKPDHRTSLPVQAFVRLLLHAGMDPNSMALLHGDREQVAAFMGRTADVFRLTQFTGSSAVADKLALQTLGKVRIEDSGFNWILADGTAGNVDGLAQQIDQDAFATSGQKCSALRLVVADQSLIQKGLVESVRKLAAKRSFSNGLVVPLLSVTSQQMKERIGELLTQVKGSKLLFGGKEVGEVNSVPSCYGLFEPTAVEVPVESLLDKKAQEVIFKEVFGPILIVVSYQKDQVDAILDSFDRIKHHLTAGIATNDPVFANHVLGNSVNGTTYVGKGRTTGAPQNHAFGPANDPRANTLGTPRSAVDTWTSHREIITDFGGRNEGLQPLPVS